MRKLTVALLLIGLQVFAGPIDFENLSREDVNGIMEEFQASFEPTTVSGASSMGKVVGFEVGLIGGMVKSSEVDRLSGGEVSSIPHAALFGRVDTLYGIGAELTLLPVKAGDFKYKSFSFAAKWTFSKVIPMCPVDLKARLRLGNTDIEYEGNDGSTNYTGKIENKSTSFDITVSKKFVFFEPYLGIGHVSSKGDFVASGSNNVFGFTSSDRVNDIKNSGVHLFGGAHVGLGIFKIGLEYGSLFGQSRIMGKLAFGI